MRTLFTTAAVVLALAGNAAAQSADWEEQRRNSLTPSYGDIAKGIGSVWWSWIVGADAGYSGSGNRCNCSVGRSDRAR